MLDMDAFKEVVGANRMRMASSDSLYEKMLLPPGVVSPFGLLNNKDHDISVYIYKEIIPEERMSFHPNTNEKTIFLATNDLLTFLAAIDYPATIIEL